MSFADLEPPTRVQALARGVLAFACTDTLQPSPFEVPPVRTMPRRMLTQEDLAWVEELTLQIGPAFRAAMKRSDLRNTRRRHTRGGLGGGMAMFSKSVRRSLAVSIATLSLPGWAIDMDGPSSPRTNQECNAFAFRVLAAIHLDFTQARTKCAELWEAGGTATQQRLNECYVEAGDKRSALEDALNRERSRCADKVASLSKA